MARGYLKFDCEEKLTISDRCRWLFSIRRLKYNIILNKKEIHVYKECSPLAREAVPQPLTVTPQQTVEHPAEDAVESQVVSVWGTPHSLEHGPNIGSHNVNNLWMSEQSWKYMYLIWMIDDFYPFMNNCVEILCQTMYVHFVLGMSWKSLHWISEGATSKDSHTQCSEPCHQGFVSFLCSGNARMSSRVMNNNDNKLLSAWLSCVFFREGKLSSLLVVVNQ